MRNPSRYILRFALCVFILCLAAYLRLAHVADNPGWYTDEGTHLDIARHLLAGRVQYLAVIQSFLLFARLPLFELLLAGALRLIGYGMLTLRLLTGCLGVISVALLYRTIRSGHSLRTDRLALLAVFLFAIYPPAVLYSRFGFSYNLLTPLVLLAVIGVLKHRRTQRFIWLAVAALAVGTGLVSDVWMGAMILPMLLCVPLRCWRHGVGSLLLMVLPFSLYAGLMLIYIPQAFLFDLNYTLSRLNAISLAQQLPTLLDNILTLIQQAGWLAAGFVGLFFLPASLRRIGLLFCGLPILILGRTTALYSLSFYYLIPLLPFVPLGVAGLACVSGNFLSRTGIPRIFSKAFVSFVVFVTFVIFFSSLLVQVQSGFITPVDIFLVNPPDAQAAAEFVNARVRSDDVIIASPAVAWQLDGQAADFQMAVAATGQAAVHLPANLPPERWAFDPRLAQARFVVVDNLWHNWGVVHMPEVDTMLHAVENWPVAFSSGEIIVYRNPAR